MKIERVNNMNIFQESYGCGFEKSKFVMETDTVCISLLKGESLDWEIATTDIFFYVLSGMGIVKIGNQKTVINNDELVVTPANIPHCLYNASNTVFKVLAVKAQKKQNIKLLRLR